MKFKTVQGQVRHVQVQGTSAIQGQVRHVQVQGTGTSVQVILKCFVLVDLVNNVVLREEIRRKNHLKAAGSRLRWADSRLRWADSRLRWADTYRE